MSKSVPPYVGKYGDVYECSCGCHRPGIAMMHITACCHPCPVCEVFVRRGDLQEHLGRNHQQVLDRLKTAIDDETDRVLKAEPERWRTDRTRQLIRERATIKILQERGTDRFRDSFRAKAEAAVDAYLDELADGEPWFKNESYNHMVEGTIDNLVRESRRRSL